MSTRQRNPIPTHNRRASACIAGEVVPRLGLAPVNLSRPMPPPLDFDPIKEAGRQWRERWGDETVSPMMAVTSVMRVQQILIARLNEVLEPFDLTFARYEALMLLYLSRRGSLPLGKMGARLQVHPTSVTNLIDRLEGAGYVERTPHPSDRRTTLAAITPRGRSVAAAATEKLNSAAFGMSSLTGSQLDAVSELLGVLRLDAGDFADEPEGPGRGSNPPSPIV